MEAQRAGHALRRARRLLGRGRARDALDELETLRADQADADTTMCERTFLTARALIALERRDDAAKTLVDAPQASDPSRVRAHVERDLARLLSGLGHAELAIERPLAVPQAVRSAGIEDDLVATLVRLGRGEEALATLDAASPTQRGVWDEVRRVMLMAALGRHEATLSELSAAASRIAERVTSDGMSADGDARGRDTSGPRAGLILAAFEAGDPEVAAALLEGDADRALVDYGAAALLAGRVDLAVARLGHRPAALIDAFTMAGRGARTPSRRASLAEARARAGDAAHVGFHVLAARSSEGAGDGPSLAERERMVERLLETRPWLDPAPTSFATTAQLHAGPEETSGRLLDWLDVPPSDRGRWEAAGADARYHVRLLMAAMRLSVGVIEAIGSDIELDGWADVIAERDAGRAVILVSSHVGILPMLIPALHRAGVPATILRAGDGDRLEGDVFARADISNLSFQEGAGALRGLARALRRGGTLAMAGEGRFAADYLAIEHRGAVLSLPVGMPSIAQRYDAAIFTVLSGFRDGGLVSKARSFGYDAAEDRVALRERWCATYAERVWQLARSDPRNAQPNENLFRHAGRASPRRMPGQAPPP